MERFEPLISVVLPVFNGEKYISESIESVLRQSYKNVELIIVNDCSNDRTLEIAGQYVLSDSRVRIINNSVNLRLPASLNIGHREAKGDLISWTSDDNRFDEDAVMRMVETMVETGADIAYCDMSIIDEKGNFLKRVSLSGVEYNIFGNHIGACFLYKKEVFHRNLGYNEQLFLVEDYDFWLKALCHSKFTHIREPLYHYRKHGESLTAQLSLQGDKRSMWQENVLQMYMGFCRRIGSDYEGIALLLAELHTHSPSDPTFIRSLRPKLRKFQDDLMTCKALTDQRTINRLFLDKVIHLLTMDRNDKFRTLRFLIAQYGAMLSKNDFKRLMKYLIK